MAFFKVNENCNGCLACVQNCPASALNYFDQENSRKILHNMSLCARCGHCWRVCPQDAIEFKVLLTGRFDLVTTLDLVHCKVCGEPIYTASLGDTVSKDTQTIEHLCPDHKGSEPVNVWKNLAAKRASQSKDISSQKKVPTRESSNQRKFQPEKVPTRESSNRR